jgi:hypothetical protein
MIFLGLDLDNEMKWKIHIDKNVKLCRVSCAIKSVYFLNDVTVLKLLCLFQITDGVRYYLLELLTI